MADKIRITNDEVNSAQVDEKLQQREFVQHAQSHYEQQSDTIGAAPAASSGGLGNLLRNSVVYMTFFGLVGGMAAWLFDEIAYQVLYDTIDSQFQSDLFTILFCAIAGLLIALGLSVAEPLVSRNFRAVLVNGAVGLCVGLVGGLFVGLFINVLYRTLAGNQTGMTARGVAARAIGWAVVGLFLGIAPGVVMRNIKRVAIGLAGGFIGGLIGGAVFDPVAVFTDSDILSRAIGLTSIGAIAGFGTGLIEIAAKTGWLHVVGGLIAGKQFVIYKNPTHLGSSPKCEIYLFKDTQVSPRHAAIHVVSGGHDIEDLGSATGTLVNGRPINRTQLKSGDEIRIGSTVLRFQEREKTV